MAIDRIIALVAIIFAAGYAFGARQIHLLSFGDPIGPRLFPYLIAGAFVVGALLLLLETRSNAHADDAAPSLDEADEMVSNRSNGSIRWMVVGVTAWTLLYVIAFQPVGYVLATAIFLLGLTFFFHRGKWVTNVAVSALVPSVTYYVFSHLLHVRLPGGLLPI